jgi:hypothetical protein
LTYATFDKRAEFIKNLYDDYIKLAEHSPTDAEKLKMTRILGMLLGLNKDEIRETDEYFLDDSILSDKDDNELEEVFSPYVSKSVEKDVLDELLEEKPNSRLDIKKLIIDVAAKVVDDSGTVNDSLVEKHFKKLHMKFRSGAREIREDRVNSDLRSEPIEYLKDVTNRIQELADRIPVLLKDSQFDSAKFHFQAKKTSKALTSLQDALNRAFDE